MVACANENAGKARRVRITFADVNTIVLESGETDYRKRIPGMRPTNLARCLPSLYVTLTRFKARFPRSCPHIAFGGYVRPRSLACASKLLQHLPRSQDTRYGARSSAQCSSDVEQRDLWHLFVSRTRTPAAVYLIEGTYSMHCHRWSCFH